MDSILLTLERTQATHDTAVVLKPSWEWPDKPIAQMALDLNSLDARLRTVATAEVEMLNARGLLDAEISGHQDQMRTFLRLGKLKYKKDRVKSGLLRPLRVRSNGRQATVELGRKVEKVWKKIEQTWAPLPELNFAAFQTCGAACVQCLGDYSTQSTEWQEESAQLLAFAETLDDTNIQWYATALKKFPVGTALGDLVRATIPTSTNSVQLAGPAVIDQATPQGDGLVRLEFHAAHATIFRVLHRLSNVAPWTPLLDGLRGPVATVEGLATGEHQFQVVGRNSRGFGTPSASAIVTLTQAQAA